MSIVRNTIVALACGTALAQPVLAETTPSSSRAAPAAKSEATETTEGRAAYRWEGSIERVKKAQEALNRTGSALKVDGVMGEDTRTELRAYQRKNNLDQTGRIDEATAKSLGIEMK